MHAEEVSIKLMITLISYHYDLQKLSGVQFHIQELGLYLREEYHIDVKEFVLPSCITNRFSVTAPKYRSILPITTNVSKVILTEMNALYAMIRHQSYKPLIDTKKVFLLASDSMNRIYDMIVATSNNARILYEILSKTTVITDRQVSHTLQMLDLPQVLVDRGIYYASWKKSNNCLSNLWFYYKRADRLGGLEKSELVVPEYIKFTTERRARPEFVYAGLVYNRYHDYMPRLPFEFWYNGKSVYLADISDGLQRMLRGVSLTGDSPIIVSPDNFPRWEVGELVTCLI